jgi:GcrA cell cycle regulator
MSGATVFWTDAVTEQLRTLFAAGHSMTIIGDRLGCGKNAVVGKINRLEKAGLLGMDRNRRRAPDKLQIVAEMTAQGASQETIGKALGHSRRTARNIQHALGIPPAHAPKGGVRPGYVAPVPVLLFASHKPPAAPPPPPPTPAPIPRREGGRQCQWLSGDTKPYVQCPEQHVPGGPYCARHMRISYPNWRSTMTQEAVA